MDKRDELRPYLADYLRQKGINLAKPFRCLNPEHPDLHPSMRYNKTSSTVHCFSCGTTYDIFDIIGLDYNLTTFPAQLQQAERWAEPTFKPGSTRSVEVAMKPRSRGAVTAEATALWAEPTFEQGSTRSVGVAMKPRSRGAVTAEATALWAEPTFEPGSTRSADGGLEPRSRGAVTAEATALWAEPTFEPGSTRSVEVAMKPHSRGAETTDGQGRGDAASLSDKTALLEALRRTAVSGFPYLRARGISEEFCLRYGLFEDSSRAYLPVFEAGSCTGWCARAKTEALQPRYKNSVGGMGLWNADTIKVAASGSNFIYITEGILNALCLEQLGRRAIALCGSQNVRKLLSLCDRSAAAANRWRFVACGDGDRAGAQMNAALSQGLKARGLSCSVLSLTDFEGDINDLFLRDSARLRAALDSLENEQSQPDAAYAATAAAAGLEAFFTEASRAANRRALSTGFDALDDLLDGGLYSGLYVLGAISSLGKTSFVLQIADYIAAHSADVLFFSLEQSRHELMAKSLSRESALCDGPLRRKAFTARQLLRGDTPADGEQQALLEQTKRVYTRAAGRLFLREGVADIGAQEIREAVREHITHRGAPPVVVVDYLQILKPFDQRATDKQNTDRAVVELKRISRDFDVPVLAISSFNRDNYRSAVSMEAFKESGAVEYSSDVLFGMQLAGAGESGFDVNAAKSREPRQVELVMLKNRNGIPFARLKLNYCAKFSLFTVAKRVKLL